MKHLHVITGLQKAAGTSVFCVELCNHLALQGEECYIAVRQKCEGDCVPDSAVSLFKVEGDPSSLSFKPDIVHIHALWDPFLHRFATWAQKNQIPLVISPHGMLTPWALKQKRLKKWLALKLYQYRDLQSAVLLHATASSEVEDMRRLGLKQPVAIAPLGVDVPDDKPLMRNNSPKIALFVSRVHPKKGLLNLVEAWAQLKGSVSSKPLVVNGNSETQLKTANDSRLTVHGFPWQLVIAGPDQDGYTAELKAKAKKHGLSVADIPANQLISKSANPPSLSDIVFTGPVYGADKDALYRKADLFVLPTYSENFGVVVIEALAQGCPVITTKGTPWAELLGNPENVNSKPLTVNSKSLTVSGRLCSETERKQPLKAYGLRLTDLTDNGRCGWWVDIGVEPLAEALREALRLTDSERRAMGTNGRMLVEARYTWTAVAEKMKQAYEWCLDSQLR